LVWACEEEGWGGLGVKVLEVGGSPFRGAGVGAGLINDSHYY